MLLPYWKCSEKELISPLSENENLWKCFNMTWVSSEQRGKHALFSKVFKTVFSICKELHFVRVNTEDLFCQKVSFYLRASLGKCYLASSFNQMIHNEWLYLTILYAFVGSAATGITVFYNFTFLSNKKVQLLLLEAMLRLFSQAAQFVCSYIWQSTISNWETFSAQTTLSLVAIIAILADPFKTISPLNAKT